MKTKDDPNVIERIEQGITLALSDQFVEAYTQIERDTARRSTEIMAVTRQLSRFVWSEKQGEMKTTKREAFWALLSIPWWKPAPRFLENRIYHTCPHIKSDEKKKHVSWLLQDTDLTPRA